VVRQGLSNVINALVRIFLKGRLHGAPTVASFFNAVILSRVWQWRGSGTNTRLRTRLRWNIRINVGGNKHE